MSDETRRREVRLRIMRHTVVEFGCWLWQAQIDADGYGKCFVRDWGEQFAHRAAFRAYREEIPEGHALDHLCRVRNCVNPWHLEPVTAAENNRRAGAAMTHCRRGHERTPENVYLSKKGVKHCRRCNAENQRKYRARKA